MVAEYNSLVAVNGWEIYPVKEISGKSVFGYRRLIESSTTHLEQARAVAARLSGHYVAQQVRRLQDAIERDPELAIGTAKEFLETLCKTILTERGVGVSKNEDLPGLVKAVIKSVKILPTGTSTQAHSEETIAALVGSLGTVGHRLAELRNQFGTGHGKATDHVGLQRRHAALAVGAAATLAVFLYECHETDKPA